MQTNETQPVFLLGSGRSGTQAVARILSDIDHIEVHHEYLFTHLLKYTVLYVMGKLSEEDILSRLRETHYAAVYYTKKKYWLDCSNILSFLLRPLKKLFPHAIYVHLVRDGRNVVSSFYHKLGGEMYPPEATRTLQEWLSSSHDTRELPEPPPEKKYWRELPPEDSPDAVFCHALSDELRQFAYICYHWKATNAATLRDLDAVDDSRKYFFKLEELSTDADEFRRFCSIFSVEFTEERFQRFQRPHNVVYPQQIMLTQAQNEIFARMCSPMMQTLGYDITKDVPHVHY